MVVTRKCALQIITRDMRINPIYYRKLCIHFVKIKAVMSTSGQYNYRNNLKKISLFLSNIKKKISKIKLNKIYFIVKIPILSGNLIFQTKYERL